MKSRLILATVILAFAFASCENENETLISSNNSDESHNAGENCMACHKSGGDGEGWFTTAGSVYEPTLVRGAPGGYISFTTEPNGAGTQLKTIEIDKFGNFYTTEKIEFGTGIYVSVTGASGNTKPMNGAITSGACNTCHTNTNKIWIN